MRILLVDNYDSFTHNLQHLISAACPTAIVDVARNLDSRILDADFDALVISPGPGGPADTGLLLKLWESRIVPLRIPVLGVCLGMQFIADQCGVEVHRCKEPIHGASAEIRLIAEHPLISNLPQSFAAARYNSLETVISGYAGSLLIPLAVEDKKDAVMITAHSMLPVCGVQYHPESFMSEFGVEIVRNFVRVYVETQG